MQITKKMHELGVVHRNLDQESIGLRESRSHHGVYYVEKIGAYDTAYYLEPGASIT